MYVVEAMIYIYRNQFISELSILRWHLAAALLITCIGIIVNRKLIVLLSGVPSGQRMNNCVLEMSQMKCTSLMEGCQV